MLPDTAALNFVQLIKLSFKQNEVTARLAFCIDHGLFESFKGVDNFKEVAMLEEVLVVFGFCFRDDGLNWNQEGILIVVVFERASAVGL